MLDLDPQHFGSIFDRAKGKQLSPLTARQNNGSVHLIRRLEQLMDFLVQQRLIL